MINIHNRNTQINYGTYHFYAGIYNIINHHAKCYIVKYFLQLYNRHPDYSHTTATPPIENFHLSFIH